MSTEYFCTHHHDLNNCHHDRFLTIGIPTKISFSVTWGNGAKWDGRYFTDGYIQASINAYLTQTYNLTILIHRCGQWIGYFKAPRVRGTSIGEVTTTLNPRGHLDRSYLHSFTFSVYTNLTWVLLFIQFWASVQREAYAADLLFYLGTICMLILTGIFFYTSRYNDKSSGG